MSDRVRNTAPRQPSVFARATLHVRAVVMPCRRGAAASARCRMLVYTARRRKVSQLDVVACHGKMRGSRLTLPGDEAHFAVSVFERW